jgi:hypothetical protein
MYRVKDASLRFLQPRDFFPPRFLIAVRFLIIFAFQYIFEVFHVGMHRISGRIIRRFFISCIRPDGYQIWLAGYMAGDRILKVAGYRAKLKITISNHYLYFHSKKLSKSVTAFNVKKCYIIKFGSALTLCGSGPQSHRRNLLTQGKSNLRFQPIAKK